MSTASIPIVPWQQLESTAWDGLVLGNGASIALHPGFRYASLFQAAAGAGRLPSTASLFAALQSTTDFEYVMRALADATAVGAALGVPTATMVTAYDEIRSALIATINQVHAAHAAVQPDLVRVAAFARQFPTIITFNYDLTLYWAMLEGNDDLGNWFKDCFRSGTFDPNWEHLRRPFQSAGATLVFYAHGSLILGRDAAGQESKVTTSGGRALLSAITSKWAYGGLAPLFVSEGTAAAKLAAIRRSPYLSEVYNHVLTGFLGKSVVVYGLSFASNDDHVLDALAVGPPSRIAVSVHMTTQAHSAQAFCHHVLSRLRARLPASVVVEFFDAASPGCWCH